MFAQCATAFAAQLYEVDAFDQPGVEESKRLAYAALGRTGFDRDAAALAEAQGADYVV